MGSKMWFILFYVLDDYTKFPLWHLMSQRVQGHEPLSDFAGTLDFAWEEFWNLLLLCVQVSGFFLFYFFKRIFYVYLFAPT